MGRRRQVIWILALQPGIMVHSPVIGLTGSEFSASSSDCTYISVLCGTRVDFCPTRPENNMRGRSYVPVVASEGASVDGVESVVAEVIALTLAGL